jgi:hypothetical protein
MLRPRY